MTKVKIAVTLRADQVVEAKRAVAEGRASSVSAYVAGAIDSQRDSQNLHTYVEELIREYGAPSDEDYDWADRQIRALGMHGG